MKSEGCSCFGTAFLITYRLRNPKPGNVNRNKTSGNAILVSVLQNLRSSQGLVLNLPVGSDYVFLQINS